tara:strand:- start:79 stop:714 length:636 start_codon:yes stop_codon:yes gene_type:complete
MFISDNITRKSNLEESDSISSYMGFSCQQNPYCFEEFYKLLESIKPSRILEIGTSLGGLTSYLKHVATEIGLSTVVRSYDIYELNWYNELRDNDNVDIRVENIFEDNYSKLTDTEIIDFIQSDGITLILCDGGNKIEEFNLLSNYMKSSDVIMAHDYAYNPDFFESEINKKYWNWHEISESDIAEAVERNNLSSFMQEGFTKAVWVCKNKQ